MALYAKIRRKANSEHVCMTKQKVIDIDVSCNQELSTCFYNNENYNSRKSQFVYIGSMRHSYRTGMNRSLGILHKYRSVVAVY